MPLPTSAVRRGGIHRAGESARLSYPLEIEGWRLLERTAEGAFTHVYRARPSDQSADMPASYAVKVLKDRWCDRAEIVELFRREALVAGKVRHPHLISVLASSTTARPYFQVSPWLGGRTLREVLESGARLDPPVALWIARQAAEALDALGKAGWMHGDVKPSNLIVSPEGHVTLLDLGFARPVGEDGSAVDWPVMGTYQYLAPELITSRLAVDARSDLYSLGVVLFQMLSGRPPFAGRTLVEMAEAHRNERPRELRRLMPALPGELSRLVGQMLAKNPWHRPLDAAEVVERLMALEIATFGQRSCG
jgi:eukaryotic-like serine/threonine-protein kinase